MNTTSQEIPGATQPIPLSTDANLGGKPASRFSRKRLAIGISILVLCLLISLGFYYFIQKKSIEPETESYILKINDTEISKYDYQKQLDYVDFYFKDRKKSIERTNDLFITNVLLKEEFLKRGKKVTQEVLVEYTIEKNYPPGALRDGTRLEIENEYLKEQVFNDSISWYSGEFILSRFNPGDPRLSQEESKKRARDKIENVRIKWMNGANFKDVVNLLNKDYEYIVLNDNQGVGGSFKKMTLDDPAADAPEFITTLQKLKIGEISEIVIFSTPTTVKRPLLPFSYAIIKLKEKNEGMAQSFNEWLTEKKKSSQININII